MWRAGGRGNVYKFISNLKQSVHGGDLSQAVEACKKQGGSLANVIGAGLETTSSRKAVPWAEGTHG